jgi:hypothetical protein
MSIESLDKQILNAVLSLKSDVGGMSGRLAGLESSFDGMASRIHDYGTRIATHSMQLSDLSNQLNIIRGEARARRAKCSEQLKRLGYEVEDTGSFIVEERVTRKVKTALWKKALAVIGALTAMAGAAGVGRWIHCNPAAPDAATKGK